MPEDLFVNYRALVKRVDERLEEIRMQAGSHMVCSKGCDACCRHISVFAVEAFAMAKAMAALGEDEKASIRMRAEKAGPEDPCPLLNDGLCGLYEARPIICRTHGYPLLIQEEEEAFLDCCPLNFSGGLEKALPMSIALEPLNRMLVAVQGMFVKESGMEGVPERMTIAEVLLLSDIF
ncbi:YkgJ family cysteine cluster protein [Desulfobotulus mexicanus]|uniref:YkgJ family cysteine cluster protein n=1 Tax=Desulfobotulus mexicanus TaxID=2586642 RepID=A0A5S5MDM5_9BACT|nr:YkgJ family cysteine cluster protein [Desulfobotulus mexicanus]TYT73846.1 YkgJ family cysteine cluster protein [Desulfobotulus mexicanus]